MSLRPGKKQDENTEDSGRWSQTYSDMITLLLIFFVILYTLSKIDLEKFKATASSIRMEFGSEITIDENNGSLALSGGVSDSPEPLIIFDRFVPPVIRDIEYIDMKYPPGEEETEDITHEGGSIENADPELAGIARDLEKKVAEKGMGQYIDILFENNNLVLRIKTEGILFDSGSARIKGQILPLLDTIAESLKFYRGLIFVEGHTDDVPINTVAYPSNWELSSARASSVLRYWVENNMVLAEDIAAAGYADTRPIGNNDTQEGRAKNRRVEILVLSRDNAVKLIK
ncbi:MAG: flagellar motor protein MotB [Actinobacteria bacterium]|nr:flagellar motor protein MotB [Actinomycetota bacterium]